MGKLCKKAKRFNKNTVGPQINHTPNEPLEILSLDLMGPLPRDRGGAQYNLAMIDISRYTLNYIPLKIKNLLQF